LRSKPEPKYSPLVIVGPSGAGKGTLIEKLVTKYPDSFGFSISCTTRPIRKSETEGVNYFFLTKEEFEAKIANNEFIEYCTVHGNYYGTLKSYIQALSDENLIALLDIDIQGAKKVYESFSNANFIFVFPPSFQELTERLMKRGTENEMSMKIRLKNALSET